MNLAVDIGNTDIKTYLIKEGTIVKIDTGNKVKSILSSYPVQNAIISSVVADHKSLINILKKQSNLFILSSSLPLPIKIKYRSPKTLGNDRIAAAAAAFKLLPKKNVLVIDAGTCIKYDFINAKGEYQGGSISPGLLMRYKALNDYTAKLPLIKPRFIKDFTGHSTEESILTGVQHGITNEISGFVALYSKKFKDLQIVLTGGDSGFIQKLLNNGFAAGLNFPIFAVPNLTGIGLNEILEYNLSL
jgi:type III pantothenate kinase